LVPFSCKRRGFCPSCAGRRMAQMAAHLVESVIPWVSTRQWVVSVPIPLRYWMASSQDLTAKVHTIIRTTIGQYYVNQAVTRGLERANVQPGSVTFIQRFGSAMNLNLHFHCFLLEGVYLDRPEAGQKVRRSGAGFGDKGEAPTLTGTRCASVHGFSLHANTQVPAHRRDQLERLIRYTARGAVSLERLQHDANGDLVYTFTHPWS